MESDFPFIPIQLLKFLLNDRYEEAEQVILASEELGSVTDISYYHGSSSYYVAKGTDSDGDSAIVWLMEDEQEPAQNLKEADGISADEAAAITEAEMNAQTIQSVKLGMENNTPLYEVKYVTDANHQGARII